MDLSILIVNWNTRDLLLKCLESVARSLEDLPATMSETLVVDNASVDGSADVVRTQFPQVRLIASQTNEGFAEANERAFKASSGEFVLLLNPDTELGGDAIREMLTFMRNDPTAGAVGPGLIDANGNLQHSCYPMPTLSREFWRLFHLDSICNRARYPLAAWSQGGPRKVDVLQGACILLRRESVGDQEELFPIRTFMYSEDVDLCFRLQANGWPLYWIPTATVIHYGGQSTRQVRTDMFIELHRSKIEFFRRNRGIRAARCYKLLLFMASLPRVLAAPLLASCTRRAGYSGISRRYLVLMRELASL